jgi:hypothetical protein
MGWDFSPVMAFGCVYQWADDSGFINFMGFLFGCGGKRGSVGCHACHRWVQA